MYEPLRDSEGNLVPYPEVITLGSLGTALNQIYNMDRDADGINITEIASIIFFRINSNGFIQLETTAGQLGEPFEARVNLSKSRARTLEGEQLSSFDVIAGSFQVQPSKLDPSSYEVEATARRGFVEGFGEYPTE